MGFKHILVTKRIVRMPLLNVCCTTLCRNSCVLHHWFKSTVQSTAL